MSWFCSIGCNECQLQHLQNRGFLKYALLPSFCLSILNIGYCSNPDWLMQKIQRLICCSLVETSPAMVSIHFIGAGDFDFFPQKWTSWFCWRILIWGRGEYGQCSVIETHWEGWRLQLSLLPWWQAKTLDMMKWLLLLLPVNLPHCCELGVSGRLWNSNCK